MEHTAGFRGILVRSMSLKRIVIPGILVAMAVAIVPHMHALAQSVDDIREAIGDRQEAKDQLDQQIRDLDKNINALSGQRESLERDQKLMQASIARIRAAERRAELDRQEKERGVQEAEEAIETIGTSLSLLDATQGSLIRSLAEYDRTPLIALAFGTENIADTLRLYSDYGNLRTSLETHAVELSMIRVQRQQSIVQLTEAQENLKKSQQELADQRTILQDTERKQARLVADTKNQESQYRANLDSLRAQRAALDAEIRDYESKLSFLLDPKQLPVPGSQPLAWPLEQVYLTQKFGRTVAAQRLYVSGSHSGIDFRAAVGTPVYAVADGVVEGVGDTDATCPKTSFGKWVFIRHPNGLATAYGHLSLIKAVQGQNVKKGDLIAYSGATGHVTGPHLHLTVYASHGLNGEEGAGVKTRPSTTCPGRTYTMPLAPTNAYLDPLLYLPSLRSGMVSPTAL